MPEKGFRVNRISSGGGLELTDDETSQAAPGKNRLRAWMRACWRVGPGAGAVCDLAVEIDTRKTKRTVRTESGAKPSFKTFDDSGRPIRERLAPVQ
jgi:hypothetical protein